ncbi:FAD-dependent oxidoreductase [Peptoniphilus sp. AGMB00490]|uniref:FAD-dependent oxidoreductase n=1 Tax=Peptoniphilus faecalis TaxID=2731255 RepID=A0A848RGT5_9FIRM|nr:FAD-dependent oxidoreductase [Peptoniphilus faecalis]NMW84961.1 FAD-dependent oxidoreductase [Peptoniphilus faecalis]
MKIIVVGGVAGGATAIARLRRLDENAEILLLERGKYVSFANCGLPYYIGGAIEERDSLFVTTKESIEDKYNIEIRTENEVLSIDKENKRVRIIDYTSGREYEEDYDKLLLSTGSSPFIPDVEGINERNIFKLWTVPDVDAIYNFIEKEKPKKAVVIGGGFIGLETAENLYEKGLEVTLVEMSDQVMPPLDKDMAKILENHLENKGVKLLLGEGFDGTENKGKTIKLKSGKKLESDITILSIGVRPNSGIAKSAGLELNERGGIKVDKFQKTSDENIYAVGDVIEVKDFILGTNTMIPLAGPANKQGRAVASNILEKREETYKATMGTSVAKVFDMTVATVGSNEKSLIKKGYKYKKDYYISLVHPMSHAGYYPGALPMTIKLIFGRDGEILGAQIVGYDGVDKRIDIIATTIYFKGNVYDLSDLELAYAPPYSSAKDPVNFAGYVATNILEGLTEPITLQELKEDKSKYTVLDVREEIEQVSGMMDEAISMPLTEIRNRIGELDKNKEYAIYCAVGIRGYIAERILKQRGFSAHNILGGYRTYLDIEGSSDYSDLSTEQDKFESSENKDDNNKEIKLLNVCGLSCPGPIVQVSEAINKLSPGEIIEVVATDPGFARDIKSWANNTGNTLLESSANKGKFSAKIQKGKRVEKEEKNPTNIKEKTMIIFDGDLDKAIASFIIATGAAAMGNKVNMFFTFWGLSILRKENAPKVKKDFMSKMFSMMLPKSSRKLGLSKMNFFGMGSKMIRKVMKDKGVSSLEELILNAQRAGVKMTACQMSMDVMGLSKEELIEGVEVGGVATMLSDNDNSNMNLFI